MGQRTNADPNENMKCYMPECKKQIPEYRIKQGWVTCSKKCSNAWNWLPGKIREKIRGKKYESSRRL